MEPDESLGPTARSSTFDKALIGDWTDVAEAPPRDVVRTIAQDQMGQSLQSQKKAENNEPEGIVDDDGSSFPPGADEMLHHLEIVEESVADKNNRNNLAHLQKIRQLCSKDTSMLDRAILGSLETLSWC